MTRTRRETIIYGGAFNPPTLAHLAILQTCREYARIHNAEVWLLPSASRHDKTIVTPLELRLALLRGLIRDIQGDGSLIRIDTTELDRPGPTETYETVQELRKSYPDRRFVWVFGTDSLASMPLWRGGSELLHTLPMLIVEREGSVTVLPGKNAAYLGIKTGGVSSTEVRRRLAAGEAYDELVSPHVGALLHQRWYA